MTSRSSRPAKSRFRRMFARLGKLTLFGGLAALLSLVVAVLIAMASLPGYEELKSSPYGQMVRVRAADGTVIVSLGPSYGDWLPYDRIPSKMVDAMVAVEDRHAAGTLDAPSALFTRPVARSGTSQRSRSVGPRYRPPDRRHSSAESRIAGPRHSPNVT